MTTGRGKRRFPLRCGTTPVYNMETMAVSSRWRAAATVATMALFGWVTACGGDRVIEPPANQAPRALGTIPTQTVHVGDTATLDVADYFTDSDGDTLSYAATTSDPETATAHRER